MFKSNGIENQCVSGPSQGRFVFSVKVYLDAVLEVIKCYVDGYNKYLLDAWKSNTRREYWITNFRCTQRNEYNSVGEGFIKNKVRNFGFHRNGGGGGGSGGSTRSSKNQTANLNFLFSLKMQVFLQYGFLLCESKKYFSSAHIHLMLLEGFFHFKLFTKLEIIV